MRIHADWITQTDERILEFLRDKGNHPPKAIHENLANVGIEYSRNHISRECRKLADHGLLVNVGAGTYSITDDGEAFLAGELDARTLDDS